LKLETQNLKPPPITLLTDFGSQDYFAGAMKGVILSVNPNAQIIDITHEIPPQDIHAAAFNLLASYKDFPAGTIHTAVVDPGVGSRRRPLLIEVAKQFFVGPDNGIFSWVCEREGNWRAIQLTNEQFFRHPVSDTFHGRDVFAPVAGALSNGTSTEKFGDEVNDIVQLESLTPKVTESQVEGRIIHIDRLGNCITNLTSDHVSRDSFVSGVRLVVNGREITSLRRFFVQVNDDKDDLFCVFGSSGFVEIAIRNSSAANVLNAERGDSVVRILTS